jgi:hypothetical protein
MKKYKPSPNRLHFGLSDECVMLRLSSDVRAPTWRKRNLWRCPLSAEPGTRAGAESSMR